MIFALLKILSISITIGLLSLILLFLINHVFMKKYTDELVSDTFTLNDLVASIKEKESFEIKEVIQGTGDSYDHIDKKVLISGDLDGRSLIHFAILSHELGHAAQSDKEKLSDTASIVTLMFFIVSIITHFLLFLNYTDLNIYLTILLSLFLGRLGFKLTVNLYYETSANYHCKKLLKRHTPFLSKRKLRIIFTKLSIAYSTYVIPFYVYSTFLLLILNYL